ncbi:serine hydrolase domain-containing protein [Chryseobacterium proteolyticum]|uniref:serine hydrolase domain-containing protein n=1 Tax=Chryseobacterium proteolyticum TaxID=118127 RepID=UPI003982DF2C
MNNNEVRFFRDSRNKIAGYKTGKDSFKLLDDKLVFPKEMWYPRIQTNQNAGYIYHQPETIADGIATGNVKDSGLNNALLDEMMKKIIDGQYPNVHSVLIMKHGELFFEEYFYEYNRNKLHELRSATKSFVSALTGIAIDEKYIKSKEAHILDYFPEYTIANDLAAKQKITIENLLTNQSGLDCDVSNPKSAGNEVDMGKTDDWVKYTLELPMIDSAGGKGMYCSGNPITMGRIIEKASGQPLKHFAEQYLFKPLGIDNYIWNFEPTKTSLETFCQLYLTPREMAKFGQLYLNKGSWNGKQIISSEWVEQSLKKHSVVQGVNYGYLWWNKYLDADGVRYYSYGAQGNGGQKIYIFQNLDMVVVITGGNYNSHSPSDELIEKYILPSFKK